MKVVWLVVCVAILSTLARAEDAADLAALPEDQISGRAAACGEACG